MEKGQEMDTAKGKGKAQVNQPAQKKEGRKADVKHLAITSNRP